MKKINKNNLGLIFIVVLAILVPLVTYLIDSSKKPKSKIEVVTSFNDFYTVDSCIGRFVSYLGDKNIDYIITVLDDNYKKKNKITKDNVLSKMPNISKDSSFISKKMYSEKKSKNVNKYYVYGQNLLEGFDEVLEKKAVYFIVYMDSKNKTFSVEPYDGNIFIGENNE